MSERGPDLVYLCDWLPPDFGAVGQYALQFARREAANGRTVALYGLSARGSSEEVERSATGALRIVRVYAPMYDRTNLRARSWWTLKTNLRLIRQAMRDMRAASEILFTGSPPLMLHLMGPLNLFLGKKLTYRITDFYPECLAVEYPRTPFILRMLGRLTKFWRRRITRFEVLGEDQRRRLLESGNAADPALTPLM